MHYCTNRGLNVYTKRSKYFTFIELLVVVAIIGMLIGMLIPVLSKARKATKVAVCQSQLKQHGYALYMYADENNGQLPPATGQGNYHISWDDLISPYEGRSMSQALMNANAVKSFDNIPHQILQCPGQDPPSIQNHRGPEAMHRGYMAVGPHGPRVAWGQTNNYGPMGERYSVKLVQVEKPSELYALGCNYHRMGHSAIGSGTRAYAEYAVIWYDYDATGGTHGNFKFNFSYVDGHVELKNITTSYYNSTHTGPWSIRPDD